MKSLNANTNKNERKKDNNLRNYLKIRLIFHVKNVHSQESNPESLAYIWMFYQSVSPRQFSLNNPHSRRIDTFIMSVTPDLDRD